MLSLPHRGIKYGEIVFQPAMIYTFIYLTLEFSRLFITARAETHPYMAMWGLLLAEASAILIFGLLFGQSCAGRDINITLVLFVLRAVPLFTLIYLINTDRMSISGIAIVLFAFYVPTSQANRPAVQQARNPEAAISGRFQIRHSMHAAMPCIWMGMFPACMPRPCSATMACRPSGLYLALSNKPDFR